MESLGFEVRNEAVLDTLTLDVIKSSEIEERSFILFRSGLLLPGNWGWR
ncbi:MAG: DUF4172 domain-containing protein [Bacteroidales bacterium]